MPWQIREWLAPDQVLGLRTLEERGRLTTDGDLFERLDRDLVYRPDAFAGVDLDRLRLSLDDEDHARFAGAQKAIVEGTTDPAVARYAWGRIGVDRALKAKGIDTEGPEAADIRADMRGQLDDFEVIEGRSAIGADIDAIVAHAVGGPVDAGIAAQASEPFDPQHIVPANNGGRPPSRPPAPATPAQRPAPGPGHNQPPQEMPPGLPQAIETWRRWFPSSPPSQPHPPPDSAGPAAAAAGDEEKQRRQALEESREHLKQLAPDHEFLKEPSDTIPDQATVDRYGKEVTRIVRDKVDVRIEELQSKSSYEQRSEIRTIDGDVDLRAEFDKLKVAGKRIYTKSGQYSEGGNGEMYELPGGIRVGFRMANDMRTDMKNSMPTLDIAVPGSNQVRFHYNPTR